MKIYTIISGVNGTGKSSLSGVLKSERSDLGFIIDVDKIGAESGLSPIEAGRIAVNKIDEYLARGVSFTQETTLSGSKTLRSVITAKENGYFIRLFYIGLNSCEESIKRIINRVEKGGHNIDDETVKNRYENRFLSLAKILPYCDEVCFYDNENGFSEVGEFKNGVLLLKGDYKPAWVIELKEVLKANK
ncbi:MAG: hypothetical protein FWD34_01470 [Oscillospiraceae bacterium]|nr:hypothetical protein [Oscillospiraceae bacterium]